MTQKSIIDYAMDEDGVKFREALYASIQDKVAAHIETKKQEIAQGLVAQPETTDTAQGAEIENS